MVADARRRVTDLERQVAATLDREVKNRVGALARSHARLVTELGGMRDTLVAMLDADAVLGVIDPGSYEDLVPRQQAALRA